MNQSQKLVILLGSVLMGSPALAQVKIGNNPTSIDSSSLLELEHPNKALFLPRVALLNTADIVTVKNPKAGMVIFNTTSPLPGTGSYPGGGAGVYYYDGFGWVLAGGGSGGGGPVSGNYWSLNGNSGVNPATDFLGTTDYSALSLRSNNQQRALFRPDGTIAMGNGAPISPSNKMEVRLDSVGGAAINGELNGGLNVLGTAVTGSALSTASRGRMNAANGATVATIRGVQGDAYVSGNVSTGASGGYFSSTLRSGGSLGANATMTGVNAEVAATLGASPAASTNNMTGGRFMASATNATAARTVGVLATGSNSASSNIGVAGVANDPINTSFNSFQGTLPTGFGSGVVGVSGNLNNANQYAGYFQSNNTASGSTALKAVSSPGNSLAPGTEIFASQSYLQGTDVSVIATGNPSVLRAQVNQAGSDGNNVRVQGSLNEANSNGRGLGQFDQPAAVGATGYGHYGGNTDADSADYVVGLRGATTTVGTGRTNSLNIVGADVGGNFNRSVGGYFAPTSGATNVGTVSQIGGAANQGWRDTALTGKNVAVAAINYNAAGANQRAIYSRGAVQMAGLNGGGGANTAGVLSTDAAGNISSGGSVNGSVSVSNGLSKDTVTGDIQLGGTLVKNTTISGGAYSTAITSNTTAPYSSALQVASNPGNTLPAGTEIFGAQVTVQGADNAPASPAAPVVLRGQVSQANTSGNNVRVQGALNEANSNGRGLGLSNQPAAVGATGYGHYGGTTNADSADYVVGLRGATTTVGSGSTNAINVIGADVGGNFNHSVGGYFAPTSGLSNTGSVSQVGGSTNQGWRDTILNGKNVAVAAFAYGNAANDRALVSRGRVQLNNLNGTGAANTAGVLVTDAAGNISSGSANAAVSVSNGLSKDTATGDIQLGGTLVKNTTINGGAYSTAFNSNSTTPYSSALQANANPGNTLPAGTEIFGAQVTVQGADNAPASPAAPVVLRGQVSQANTSGNNVRVQGALNEANSNGRGLGLSNQPAAVGATGYGHYGGNTNADTGDYVVGLRGATTTVGSGSTNAINVVGADVGGNFNRSVGGYFAPTSGTTNVGTVSQIGGTTNQGWRDTALTGKNIAVAAINYNAAGTNQRAIYSRGAIQMAGLNGGGGANTAGVLSTDAAGNISSGSANAAVSVSNGLSKDTVTGDIQLGGTLVKNTTVSGGAYSTAFTTTSTAPYSSALQANANPGNSLPTGTEIFGAQVTVQGSDVSGTATGSPSVLRGQVSQANTSGNNVRVQGALNEANSNGRGLGQFNQPAAVGATGYGHYGGTTNADSADYVVGLRGATTTVDAGSTNAINVVGADVGGNFNRSVGGYFAPTSGATNVGTVSQVGGGTNQGWRDTALTGKNIAVAAINYNAAGTNQRAIYSRGAVQMAGLNGGGGANTAGVLVTDAAGNISSGSANAAVSVSNGLSKDTVTGDIQLGGTLVKNTTINGGAYSTTFNSNSTAPYSSALQANSNPGNTLPAGTEIFGAQVTVQGADNAPASPAAPVVLRGQVSQANTSGDNVRVQGALNEANSNGRGLGLSNQPAAVGATGYGHYGGTTNADSADYVVGLRGATTTVGGGSTNAINVVGADVGGNFNRSVGGYFAPTSGATNVGTVSQVGGGTNQGWRDTALTGKNVAVAAINYNAAGANQRAIYSRGAVQLTGLGTTGGTSLLAVDAAGNVSTTAIPAAVQADNGLTKTGDTIQLGGTLVKNTTVSGGAYSTAFTTTSTAPYSSALQASSNPGNTVPDGNEYFGAQVNVQGADNSNTLSGNPVVLRGQVSQANTSGNNVRVQGALNEANSNGRGLGLSNQPAAVGATGYGHYGGATNADSADYVVGLRGATTTVGGGSTNAINVVGADVGGNFNRSVGGYFAPTSGATNVGTVSQIGGTANQGWRDTALTGKNVAVAAINYNAAGANQRAIYSRGAVQMAGLNGGGANTAGVLVTDAAGNISSSAANAAVSVSNGLSKDTATGDIQLGGTLVKNTTVSGGAYSTAFTTTSTAPYSSALQANANPGNTLPAGNEYFGAQVAVQGADNSNAFGVDPVVLRGQVSQAGSNGNNVRVQGALNEANSNGVGLGQYNQPAAVGATGYGHYGGAANALAGDYVVGLRGATTTTSTGQTSALNVVGTNAGGSFDRSVGGYFAPTSGATNVGTVSQIGGATNEGWRDTALTGRNVAVAAINYNAAGTNQRAIYSRGAVQMAGLSGTGGLMAVDGSGNLSKTALTGDNGITVTGTTVALGGSLSSNTDIATAGNNLTLSGTGSLGVGTTTPNATVQINGSMSVKARRITSGTSYNVAPDDYLMVFTNGFTAPRSVTLPNAVTAMGRILVIKNIAGADMVTSGYTNFNGTTNVTIINSGRTVTLISDGTEWQEISEN